MVVLPLVLLVVMQPSRRVEIVPVAAHCTLAYRFSSIRAKRSSYPGSARYPPFLNRYFSNIPGALLLSRPSSLEHSLALATVAEVAMEALAGSCLVVAEATAGAVATLGGTVAVENVLTGGTLLLGAVRTAVAQIALAPDVLGGIPRRLIGGTGGLGKGLLRHADATVGALVGAQGALAGHTVVSLEALALAAPAVADALVGALHPGVGVVGADNVSRPGSSHGTCTKGAVSSSVSGLAERVAMTATLVV